MLVWTRSSTNDPHETPVAAKRTRRGATLMEYLMMISLIITVCLVGVGYFGSQTNSVATATSNAISKAVKGS